MARIPYLEQKDLAPDYKDLLARNINLYRGLVHSPEGARSWSTLGRFIRFKSKFDPRLREMVILQIGYMARSTYEFSHHVKIGKDFGVSEDDIRAIIDETEGRVTSLSKLELLVLRAAREMTRDLSVSDETFSGLTEFLDNELIVELVMIISFYNAVIRVLATLRIDVEEEYLPYLKKFPLPPDKQ
jgi:alkylhydroperoxidase family enzyme